jgi:RHS repeat-associated protein
VPSLPTVENYSFDATGNRTNNGADSASGTHNRLQSDGTYTYQYDNEGNQTSRTEIATGTVTQYTYDHRNRLTKVVAPGKTVLYQYDAQDRRIGKQIDENSNGSIEEGTFWVWDGNQVVLQFKDHDGSGSHPYQLTNRYLYGDIVDLLLADEQVGVEDDPYGSSSPYGSSNPISSGSTTNRILWPLADHLNSIRDLMDSEQRRREHKVYDTFGRTLSETDFDMYGTELPAGDPAEVDTLFGYTGREWDEDVGLQYNRARWYDPAQGRWLSQDPIGFAGGDANLYRYVGNSPTNATDPSGRIIVWVDGIDTDKSNTHAESVANALRDFATKNGLAEQGFLYFDFPQAKRKDGSTTGSDYDKKVAAKLKKLLDAIQAANNCGEPVYLVGFSNGTDIARLALESGAKVDGLVFLGSAVDRDTDLQKMMAGAGWFHNYWSESDYVAGTFADGMGSRPLRENGKIKNKSLPNVTTEEVDGFVHTENGGDKGGSAILTSKDKKTRVPWTSYFAGFSLLGKLLKPTGNDCLTNGGEFLAPDGTKIKVKPGFQTVPSGIDKR